MKHKLKWFQNRVSKRVFRDAVDCPCIHCTDAGENGLVIADDQHARELYEVQFEIDINYRDKK